MGQPLHEERGEASADFTSWYSRCVAILVITPETTVPVKPRCPSRRRTSSARSRSRSTCRRRRGACRRRRGGSHTPPSYSPPSPQEIVARPASWRCPRRTVPCTSPLVAKLSPSPCGRPEERGGRGAASPLASRRSTSPRADRAPMSAEILKNNLQPPHVDFIVKHTVEPSRSYVRPPPSARASRARAGGRRCSRSRRTPSTVLEPAPWTSHARPKASQVAVRSELPRSTPGLPLHAPTNRAVGRPRRRVESRHQIGRAPSTQCSLPPQSDGARARAGSPAATVALASDAIARRPAASPTPSAPRTAAE